MSENIDLGTPLLSKELIHIVQNQLQIRQDITHLGARLGYMMELIHSIDLNLKLVEKGLEASRGPAPSTAEA